MRSAKEINDLFKTLTYKIYANRTNDGTPEGCEQAMDDSIRIERIADKFAIGFAEWCIQRDEHYPIQAGRITAKELLEIYKKEKGL
jgi:hypothetical protein